VGHVRRRRTLEGGLSAITRSVATINWIGCARLNSPFPFQA
jgi:hypothetical protein